MSSWDGATGRARGSGISLDLVIFMYIMHNREIGKKYIYIEYTEYTPEVWGMTLKSGREKHLWRAPVARTRDKHP
jgi:hypothetical protein